mmetsp:Transcript_140932/g.450633  ORF Transcript_140932/g.450633 Transcript_140932/m.450633 type:complete len:357 (+) Transcript_140932:986-2056(+)
MEVLQCEQDLGQQPPRESLRQAGLARAHHEVVEVAVRAEFKDHRELLGRRAEGAVEPDDEGVPSGLEHLALLEGALAHDKVLGVAPRVQDLEGEVPGGSPLPAFGRTGDPPDHGGALPVNDFVDDAEVPLPDDTRDLVEAEVALLLSRRAHLALEPLELLGGAEDGRHALAPGAGDVTQSPGRGHGHERGHARGLELQGPVHGGAGEAREARAAPEEEARGHEAQAARALRGDASDRVGVRVEWALRRTSAYRRWRSRPHGGWRQQAHQVSILCHAHVHSHGVPPAAAAHETALGQHAAEAAAEAAAAEAEAAADDEDGDEGEEGEGEAGAGKKKKKKKKGKDKAEGKEKSKKKKK